MTTVEVKSGYGLETAAERKSLRVARRLAGAPPVTVRTTFLGAHALPPEFADDRAAYVETVAETMMPALAADGLVDAVDAFCERIAFTPEEVARVFGAARRLRLPVKLHADQLSNGGGAALAAEFGALSADHLEYTDEAGVAAMARAGVVAVLLPGAYYTLRERQAPPVALLRKHRVPIAVATDCESRHLAADVDPARAQHGGDAVRPHRRGMPRRRHARRRRARSASAPRRERSKPANGRISRSGTSSARPSSSIASGFNPLVRARLERPMTVTLRAGEATLDRLARDLARRAGRARSGLPRGRRGERRRRSQRILGRGEPVYGINTGFGKLAGVRIEPADLARLQRNIVLSHAAGVGEPVSDAVTRLMMALKLGSLAQGASGVRPETLDLHRGDARRAA